MLLFVLFLVAAAIFGVGGVINELFWIVLIGIALFFAAVIRGLGLSNGKSPRTEV